MRYRLIISFLNFFSDFKEAYTDWATRDDPYFYWSDEDDNVDYTGFVDLEEDVWKKVHSGAVYKSTIQWFQWYEDGDYSDLYDKEILPGSTIETGSISFNDDETRSGTITITNGDGKWVRKRNLDHLDICEPGLDELDGISGMTLEEYREDKLTVIRFS